MLSVESCRGAASDEGELLEALRAGDERAFATLIDAYGPQMLRVAMLYAPSRAVAEEVVQETWLHVLEGLDRFGQRSTLKTWIFRILANAARSRAKHERRSVSLPNAEEADTPARTDLPEHGVLASEVRAVIADAIRKLPPAEGMVITLRDVDGWSSAEVCDALELSGGNQRVRLHRARAAVRRELAGYLDSVY
jgi:RNA polymerase sigma-70 factor (ECF subfamily)